MLDDRSISAFLHFGFVPEIQGDSQPLIDNWNKSDIGINSLNDQRETSLVNEGVKVLRNVFKDYLSEFSETSVHVIPLSGGLDSRGILGGLLENLPTSQIKTVTYGIPGSLDLSIANLVSENAKVSHKNINLSSTEWTWEPEELVKFSSRLNKPMWIFDTYVNAEIPRRYGNICIYWSGFMGEALSGAHLFPNESKSWNTALNRFVDKNCFSKSMRLSPCSFKPESILPQIPYLDPKLISYDDQLDFAIRQHCWIKSIVLHEGYNYQTPYLHPAWVNFILSVPIKYRRRQLLYKEILKNAYPKLFSLPTKTNQGLPLQASRMQSGINWVTFKVDRVVKKFWTGYPWRKTLNINYCDFNFDIRERHNFKTLVYDFLESLNGRNILDWIDIDTIWRKQQIEKKDLADAITLLVSLEIYLQGQELL